MVGKKVRPEIIQIYKVPNNIQDHGGERKLYEENTDNILKCVLSTTSMAWVK